MSEQIDLKMTEAVMEDAVRASEDTAVRSHQEFLDWSRRVRDFSELCAHANLKSYIAALGNAILAKASNPRIDVFSLKAGDKSPGAYDARRSTEKVLVPASQTHRFSLGTTGPQPLNNQPFFREYRITNAMTVRGHAKPVLGKLIQLLHEAQQLRREEAVRALAAFVDVRRAYVPTYSVAEGNFVIWTADQLAGAVREFVSRRSEGGGRAQAAVGGLLDALFTSERVRVGKRNEPDRHMPGDVGVRQAAQETAPYVRVFEVRDKNVPPHAVLAFVAKVAAASVGRATLLGLAADQESLNRGELRERARESGVDLEVFTDLAEIVRAIIFASELRETPTVESAITGIRRRLVELELSQEALQDWDALTIRDPEQ